MVCKSQRLCTVTLWEIMESYQIIKLLRAIDDLAGLECYAKQRIAIGERDLPVDLTFSDQHIRPVLKLCAEPCKDLGLRASLQRIQAKILPLLGTDFHDAW